MNVRVVSNGKGVDEHKLDDTSPMNSSVTMTGCMVLWIGCVGLPRRVYGVAASGCMGLLLRVRALLLRVCWWSFQA